MATEQKNEKTMPPREPRRTGVGEREHRREEEGLGRERSQERTPGRETTESARER